mmetsp:Transcript_43552/g.98447  ORF Transcript_43552/g.98447 Transcript_43552/m.98447 type:complete len:241 (+) Transcript_43552:637-1359(+)
MLKRPVAAAGSPVRRPARSFRRNCLRGGRPGLPWKVPSCSWRRVNWCASSGTRTWTGRAASPLGSCGRQRSSWVTASATTSAKPCSKPSTPTETARSRWASSWPSSGTSTWGSGSRPRPSSRRRGHLASSATCASGCPWASPSNKTPARTQPTTTTKARRARTPPRLGAGRRWRRWSPGGRARTWGWRPAAWWSKPRGRPSAPRGRSRPFLTRPARALASFCTWRSASSTLPGLPRRRRR